MVLAKEKRAPDDLMAYPWFRRVLWGLLLVMVYLVTSIPVGLYLYSLKNKMGWDIFSIGGYHSFMYCFTKEIRFATEGRNAEEQRKYDEKHGLNLSVTVPVTVGE